MDSTARFLPLHRIRLRWPTHGDSTLHQTTNHPGQTIPSDALLVATSQRPSPIPFHDPTILPGSLPGFPPSHPLAMADPTQVLQQIAAQRAAAALMQTNLTSPWANLQANMMSNQAKAKPGRLKVQTGSSPVGSSHNSRVNTPSLPSSPLRLNHHRESNKLHQPLADPLAQPRSSIRVPEQSARLVSINLAWSARIQASTRTSLSPDSAAGQSIVQEAALENLGFGMGLGGIGGTIMTPYGPLSYEMARARDSLRVPRLVRRTVSGRIPQLTQGGASTTHSTQPASITVDVANNRTIPKTDTQPEIGTHGVVHQKLNRTTGTSPGTPTTSTTTSAALSSFTTGPVSSASSVSPPLTDSPDGRRSPSILSDILADDFFSNRPAPAGGNQSANLTARRPTVTFAASPVGSPGAFSGDSPTPSGAGCTGLTMSPAAGNIHWQLRSGRFTLKREPLFRTNSPGAKDLGQTKADGEQDKDKDKGIDKEQSKEVKQRSISADEGRTRARHAWSFRASRLRKAVMAPDDAMDWRAVSRSRSRISMDWRAGSRSRSRPPWDAPRPRGEWDASEAHSHALLAQGKAQDAQFIGQRNEPEPIPEEGQASLTKNSSSVPIPIRPAGTGRASPTPAYHHSLGHMPQSVPAYDITQGGFAVGADHGADGEDYFPRRVRKTSFDHTVQRPDFAAHNALSEADINIMEGHSHLERQYHHAPPGADNFFDLPSRGLDEKHSDGRLSISPSHTLSPGQAGFLGHSMGIGGLMTSRDPVGLNQGLPAGFMFDPSSHALSAAAHAAVAESEARYNAVTMSIVNAGLDNVDGSISHSGLENSLPHPFTHVDPAHVLTGDLAGVYGPSPSSDSWGFTSSSTASPEPSRPSQAPTPQAQKEGESTSAPGSGTSAQGSKDNVGGNADDDGTPTFVPIAKPRPLHYGGVIQTVILFAMRVDCFMWKLHGVTRPMSLKTDVIKKRNRASGGPSGGSRKSATPNHTPSQPGTHATAGRPIAPSTRLTTVAAAGAGALLLILLPTWRLNAREGYL
ncbi:Pleckstrin homology domain [Rhizoctonia solani]|uniref:Pleckstrin homology domain n=1 Tax=Rhizoctonia solani TaxID=456999 RepID=A0A8H7M1Y3_9AGAM|nr:Pleckstrin homology domain [Rhizoctonia solani]